MDHPILYEINTRAWVRALGDLTGGAVFLDNVPEAEFERWVRLGFTHIWLMGVWSTGPRSRAEALQHPDLVRHYNEILPDWTPEDVTGSPYAIGNYAVHSRLGGNAALAEFRQRLHRHGLKLLLDFVPNHVGLDHPWVQSKLELFIHSAESRPEFFREVIDGESWWLAHGKDPNFPCWTDTVQLDYSRGATRRSMTEVLHSLASKCDGLRCDMAMLLLNDVFVRTLGPLAAGEWPKEEFWETAITEIKATYPGFLFLAEAYWDLEERLQELGFDFTYDKKLYDYLANRQGAEVQKHLVEASPQFLAASAHFLENHDEPPIAARLSLEEHRAAALVVLGIPGMRFLYEGKLQGSLILTRVQLARRPREAPHPQIVALYETFLAILRESSVGHGVGRILNPRRAWDENATADFFILAQWQSVEGEFDLVVVNLAAHRSQCYAPVMVNNLAERNWWLRDLAGEEDYLRRGDDLERQGLYLDVRAHAAQIFRFTPV